ncbi:MAG: elongation factor G [Chloroflexota bacterium]|nr:elongation factor G [Chloroflexota bacterium]
MKEYTTEQLRNIALIGHSGSGKTTFVESALFLSKATKRRGTVEEGNTVTDFDAEEINRNISLSTALAPVEWKKKHKLNLLDTPGYADFMGEVKSALRVSEVALTFIDAVAGVEVGTELTWVYAAEEKLAHMVVVNKMDRENADFGKALESLKETFEGTQFVPVLLPIGSQDNFQGVVNVLEKRAYLGAAGTPAEIPADMREQVEELSFEMMEYAAEGDDELLMKYLDGEELTVEEIITGLRQAVVNRTVVPVMAAAGVSDVGVPQLLDLLVNLVPHPAEVAEVEGLDGESWAVVEDSPLALLVFKTMADSFVGKISYFRVCSGLAESGDTYYNLRADEDERVSQLLTMRGSEQLQVERLHPGDLGAATKMSSVLTNDTLCREDSPVRVRGVNFPSPLYSVAIYPHTKRDTAKMGSTLTRICEEDPSLQWEQNPATNETILSGMGGSHVNTAVRRIKGRFDVSLDAKTPKVPYKETITRTASARYRHKKQSGGAGQFGEVQMRVEPRPRDEGFEYAWEVFGGHISTSFRPSVEKGVRSVLKGGVVAGYPIVDVLAAVYDGKEHPVDSKDIAFQVAGREAFKAAFIQARPVLLEPVYNFAIKVPNEFTGDIISDLNGRRGRVQGMVQEAAKTIITAHAPLAEMQQYAANLRALTQGRGVYTMEFANYAVVPGNLAQEIIAESQKEDE